MAINSALAGNPSFLIEKGDNILAINYMAQLLFEITYFLIIFVI